MKRYEIDHEMCDASKVMDEEPDGSWVYYYDHLAEVEKLRSQLLSAENRAELWEYTARRLERELAAGRGEP